MVNGRLMILFLVGWLGWLTASPALWGQGERTDETMESEDPRSEGDRRRPKLRFGFEAKAHYRDSDLFDRPIRIRVPEAVIPGGSFVESLRTVNPGSHLEISTVTLFVDVEWSEAFAAHAKIDFIDLYDRNPTSTDREVDVDEAWIRFGREAEPAVLPERPFGAYLKVGKFPHFERQDDRHLESYGLVATAFNRMEDVGLELGVDLGRHVYFKVSATQGNPVFLRDPNALAGDNGTPELLDPLTEPELNAGVPIPYDAEVEDLDVDGDIELGAGLGLRFGDETGDRGVDFLAWSYARDLAETVDFHGTFYGGDLDLLRGPFNITPFPLTDDEKSETGANLWVYFDGFSFFGQYVDQDLGGLDRTGIEGEVAWRFGLPLVWGVGGRQLFPFIQPAVRFSRLDPKFGIVPGNPTPSFAWEWEKIDLGLRLGILEQTDLTLEWALNDFIVAGRTESQDEFLVTLRIRRK